MFSGFVGSFVMVPDELKFEVGHAPLDGRYVISIVENQTLRFDMSWHDVTGASKSESYETVVDGAMHPYSGPYVAEEIQTTLLSPTVMETKTYKNGGVISQEIRELSPDGNRLIVTQTGALPLGAKFTNRSVYVKA